MFMQNCMYAVIDNFDIGEMHVSERTSFATTQE
jgi:hypothetical protein